MTASETLESILSVYCDDCISASRTDDCEKSCADIEALNKALGLLELKEQNRIIEMPVPIGTYCYKIHFDTEYDKYLGTDGEWRFCKHLFEADDIEDYLEHKENYVATVVEAERRLAELRGE